MSFSRIISFLKRHFWAIILVILGIESCIYFGIWRWGRFNPPKVTSSSVQSVESPIHYAQGNWLINPGFEAGDEGWFFLERQAWKGFRISQDIVFEGLQSVFLSLSEDVSSGKTAIHGAIQEIKRPDRFPTRISGQYYVRKWQKTTPLQYVQFVLIVFFHDGTNQQIRYPLAGIQKEPFLLTNAQFCFIDRIDEPKVGQWVAFSRNPSEDWKTFWGNVPENVLRIRLLLEVRYDDLSNPSGSLAGEVFFDDLFLGDALFLDPP